MSLKVEISFLHILESDLHLSLSVAVAVTAVLRLVLEAEQVNTWPWSARVTEP